MSGDLSRALRPGGAVMPRRSRFFGKRSRRAQKETQRRLLLESLEQRQMLAYVGTAYYATGATEDSPSDSFSFWLFRDSNTYSDSVTIYYEVSGGPTNPAD